MWEKNLQEAKYKRVWKVLFLQIQWDISLILKKSIKKKKRERETVIKQCRIFQIIWGQLINLLIGNFLANFSFTFLCFLAVD